MKITREQALYGAKASQITLIEQRSIADYMRDQKLNAVDEMSFGLQAWGLKWICLITLICFLKI